ncbi:MAG: peptidoglycan DD-metalloendopeptidase family protein [Pseudomonas marincola]
MRKIFSRSPGKPKKKNSYLPLLTIIGGGMLGGVLAYTLVPTDETITPAIAMDAGQQSTSEGQQAKTDQAVKGGPASSTQTTEQVSTQPTSKTVSVGKGDTLMKVLVRAGVDPQESHAAITALSSVFDPRRLKIGQDITLNFSNTDLAEETKTDDILQLVSVSLNQDVDKQVAAIRSPDRGFKAKETIIELEKKMARVGGTIENSLFLSAAQSGLPNQVTLQLIRIFSYDVDFQREIQTGDQFEVYFERFVDENGRALKEGRIQWASMTLSGQKISLYRFETKDDGFTDYYDQKGRSVRKTLMRTPIDGARLTSRFGKRKHPILGYTKMHKGADFGAPRGTPIMAAGNGTVEMAGRNGAYGNYIRIRHTSEYKTAYAHMKGFAKKVRKGSRVKQGQIIGYVGTTGRSTGPHLHYEVHKNGRLINPLSVKLPAGRKLKGKMLTTFKSFAGQMDKAVAALPVNTKVAKLTD